jgi:hypothetical protein
MKKYFFALLSFLMFSILISSSCNKDDDSPPPKTKTQLISQSTWKFSGATVGGNDVSAFLQTCQKDNILTFSATGGTGTLDEGATKCNSGDPQTNPFTWNFLNSETELFISATLFSGGSSTFTLVSLTETTLVLSQVITVSGTAQTAIVTFIH